MAPLFISPAKASAAAAVAISKHLADTCQVVHRAHREDDRSISRGFAAVLFKAGRFIGHADGEGRVVTPSLPIFSA